MASSYDRNTDGSNIYYNAQIFNNTDYDINARYSTIATSDILDNPGNYCITIDRFSIPSDDVPLFIFKDDTTYSVTLEQPASGAVSQVYLQYTNREPSDPRKPVYSFDHMVQMVNTALATAFANVTAGASGIPPSNAPELVYDELSGLFSFIVDNEYADSYADRFEIYMNFRLFKYFESFYIDRYQQPQANGKDRRIVIFNKTINEFSASKLQVKQQYESRGSFYEMKSVVIKTSTLPIRYERASRVNGGVSEINVNILSDYTPFSSTPYEQRSRMIYYPSHYRWTDLIEGPPLRKVDFEVFWQSIEGELYPLYVSPYNYLSVKFLMRPKALIS